MTSFLFTIAYNFLSFLINHLPSGGVFPTEVHSAFSTLGGYVGMFDVFVPISTLLYCLLLLFSVEIGVFAFKTIKWLVSHIPLIGGKGNH